MTQVADAREGVRVVHHGDDEIAMPVSPGKDILSPTTRGEIDVQVTTARAYPRSIKAFKTTAMEMATLDEETAAGCFYSIPRGGKPIEGPSARLAEIVLSAWGNTRADARVIDVGPTMITAEGMCWDLEKNIAIRTQVKRRITDKFGKRYNEDMIIVTGNAACSIALRNAVFKVIPMAYTRPAYQEARRVAIGDVKTLEAKRGAAIDHFAKMGIQLDRVLNSIGKKNVEEIGLDELATLKGMATALKEGDSTPEDLFPPVPKEGAAAPIAAGSRADALAAKHGKPVENEATKEKLAEIERQRQQKADNPREGGASHEKGEGQGPDTKASAVTSSSPPTNGTGTSGSAQAPKTREPGEDDDEPEAPKPKGIGDADAEPPADYDDTTPRGGKKGGRRS